MRLRSGPDGHRRAPFGVVIAQPTGFRRAQNGSMIAAHAARQRAATEPETKETQDD
jgi:hypothetical protein